MMSQICRCHSVLVVPSSIFYFIEGVRRLIQQKRSSEFISIRVEVFKLFKLTFKYHNIWTYITFAVCKLAVLLLNITIFWKASQNSWCGSKDDYLKDNIMGGENTCNTIKQNESHTNSRPKWVLVMVVKGIHSDFRNWKPHINMTF